ncbi:hypothetical protein EYF80_066038 [Liparis tanakae]|uniref:Uncharacterized protein n=1 Tax=Liparis tanakae TaxID=230148 RepID=A0A4Z2E5H3_9TELE|nr:hypothetical protein EYF80_066038 [Liparis tanakae]
MFTGRVDNSSSPVATGVHPLGQVMSLIRQNKTARCFATPEPLWTGATGDLTPPEEVFRA